MGQNRAKKTAAFMLAGIVVLLLAGVPSAWSLDPHKGISQYIQTSWKDEAGLPQNSVHAIAQTADGFIWLGTEEGLVRFDGVQFRVYQNRNTPGLPSDYIQSLAAATDGSLWVGTDSGLSHFVPSPGPATPNLANGTFDRTFTSKDGLPGDRIETLYEDAGGTLWVGTANGLSRIRGGRIDSCCAELAGAGINAIVADARHRVWIGADKGLYAFDGGRPVNLPGGQAIGQEIMAIAPASDGSLWLGTFRNGLIHLKDGRELPSPSVPKKEIGALLVDRDGSLWISFQRGGIARWSDGKLSVYDAAHGLPSNRITRALFEDRGGGLWVGMLDAGVVQFRDGAFSVFGTREGLAGNYVGNILQAPDGSMWIGSDSNGLNHLLPDGTVELWNHVKGLPASAIFSLLETRDGDLWVGFRSGALARIHNRHIQVFQERHTVQTSINALFQDRSGQIWVGFYGRGIARFTNGVFDHLTDSGHVQAITQAADGAIWWAADGEGVSRYSNGSIQRITTADGLPSNHAMCLDADPDGDIWVGTASGGLTRIRDGKLVSWTPQKGLPESTIGSVVEDNHGNLWLGGDSGIYSIPKQILNAPGHPSLTGVRAYGSADGLRSHETVYGGMPASWRDRSGRLWFATIAGAAVVDPNHLPAPQLAQAWIESVQFDGQAVALHPGSILGPGSDNLELAYTAPAFSPPWREKFRYRLVGFDRNWIEAGTRHHAWYTNLSPGRYTFEVQAANRDGSWSPRGDSFGFVLRPPLTRTPLAYAAYVLLLVLAVWALLALRTRTLLRRQLELSRIVAERTAQLEEEKLALEAARQELQTRATHDSLTEIFNRAAIIDHLTREVHRGERHKTPLGVLILDLDYFKQVNDRFGHLCGDDVIREAATRLKNAMRKYDLVGRYGGEEFLILFPGWTPDLAPGRIDDLLDSIRSLPFAAGEHTIEMTCSIGVSVYRPEIDSPDLRGILARADAALYAAKHSGRNCARIDGPGVEAVFSNLHGLA